MSLKCEFSAKYLIPALRFMIAKKLIDEYELTQSEAARLLGVTQPSISHYLNSKRGIKIERILSRSKEVKEIVDKYVEELVSSGSPNGISFCTLCEVAFKYLSGRKRPLDGLR
ncbi:MAG: helix-turn-helix domain-containing protein [Nitrososphaerota archaeon]|nr:helix-turn-helix domain-containing protein [Nitrososphaerota archaeon]